MNKAFIGVASVLLFSFLGARPAASQTIVLLEDNFDDGVLDTTKWTTLLLSASSSVVEKGGVLQLTNRGWLLTKNGFGGLDGDLLITGRMNPGITSGGLADIFKLFVRANVIPEGSPYYDNTDGAACLVWWPPDAHINVVGLGAVSAPLVSDDLPAPIGPWFGFDLELMNSVLRFTVWDESAPGITTSVETPLTVGAGVGDRIIIFNREAIGTDHVMLLDDIRISVPDCNGNGVPDDQDLLAGTSLDCNVNGIPDECELAAFGGDIDGDGQLDDCVAPPLMADVYELSVAAGGTQTFSLTASVSSGIYLLLGTASGTSPGVPSGGLVVPLNIDSYLLHTALAPNTPPLTGSLGFLMPSGGQGVATASFTLPPSFDPALVGLTLHHAYVTLGFLSGQITSVSNAVPLDLLP